MPIKVAYLKFFLSFRFFQHLSFIIIIIIIIIIIVSTGTIYCRIQEDANETIHLLRLYVMLFEDFPMYYSFISLLKSCYFK